MNPEVLKMLTGIYCQSLGKSSDEDALTAFGVITQHLVEAHQITPPLLIATIRAGQEANLYNQAAQN